MKPKLKALGTKRLELKYDGLLSRFAFKFKLRRYTKEWNDICPNLDEAGGLKRPISVYCLGEMPYGVAGKASELRAGKWAPS